MAPITAQSVSSATRRREKAVWTTLQSVVLSLLAMSVSAGAASAQVRITAAWEPNVDGLTAGYRVAVGTTPGVPLAEIDAGAATSATLPLPPGNIYYVTVRGYSAQGALGPSSPEAVVDLSGPPGTPSSFQAAINGPSALLQWTPPVTGGLASNYLLSVGTAPGVANLLSGHPVGAVLGVSGDLPPGIYYARLQALNLLGIGPPIDTTFEVGGGYRPRGPSGLAASVSATNVHLRWSPPSGGSPAEMPAAYLLEAGSVPGASDLVSAVIGNITSFSASAPPGTYYVRVRGVNARGVSDASNEVRVRIR